MPNMSCGRTPCRCPVQRVRAHAKVMGIRLTKAHGGYKTKAQLNREIKRAMHGRRRM